MIVCVFEDVQWRFILNDKASTAQRTPKYVGTVLDSIHTPTFAWTPSKTNMSWLCSVQLAEAV
jgi:hypothetical protein